MKNNNIAEQINRTIEDIWITLEKKEGICTNSKLSNQQCVLLTLVIRHPSSSPTELAEKMNITKSAVSQQLAKLENEGYVIRKQYVEDKRSYTIELGKKGYLYKKEIEAFNRKISKKYHANLSLIELTNMLSALSKLQEVLEQL